MQRADPAGSSCEMSSCPMDECRHCCALKCECEHNQKNCHTGLDDEGHRLKSYGLPGFPVAKRRYNRDEAIQRPERDG